MDSASQLLNKALGRTANSEGVQFWSNPERCGWLLKQGK